MLKSDATCVSMYSSIESVGENPTSTLWMSCVSTFSDFCIDTSSFNVVLTDPLILVSTLTLSLSFSVSFI